VYRDQSVEAYRLPKEGHQVVEGKVIIEEFREGSSSLSED